MIRFVARRRDSQKVHVGIALLPEDLRELMSGFPQFTVLSEIIADNARPDTIGLYFFRDLEEFRDAMRAAGITTRVTMMTDGPSQFAAPPSDKIGNN
jgi:hypothetical protein